MADNNGVDGPSLDANPNDPQPHNPNGETPNVDVVNPADPDALPSEDDEVIITIGEEAPPQDSEDELELTPAAKTAWFHMRREKKEKEQRIRELERALADKNPVPATPVLGAKPTLEDCEFDTDVFEQKLTAWHDQKRAVETEAAKQQQAAEQAQQAWQQKVQRYQAGKAELKVSDFEDAEATVLDMLDSTQQGIILAGADNPTNLTYALGKNPAKLKELASIKDPVQYAFAVAKLETQLKVTQRKSAPPAERRIVGNGSAVAVNDPKLARLEAEADKTGDRSALIAYKKASKSKAA